MEERFHKFQSSLQPAVKLSIAAEEFAQEETPAEFREKYCEYLRLRLGPAAQKFVQDEDTVRLEKLWQLQNFSEGLLNELLAFAAGKQKNAAFVWLLRKKEETFGFPARDLSL